MGVGASAGGVEAFSQLLRNLPPDTGMAFVLVQHLAPKHESILASILARETAMPVQEAAEGMRLEPNHVYVIPPDRDVIINDGRLDLQPRTSTDGRHMPVDLFLRTLADVRGSQAVAVVLSGTGNDGTLGCQAVKAAGGISFAQDPGSARYDGMPRSAIAAGCVDLVLPPEEIAREIQRLSADDYLRPQPEKPALEPVEEDVDRFHRILLLMKKGTGTDFSSYRRPTLLRRLRRRMTLWKIERLREYVSWLEHHPGELEALHQDFLINVTTFFRDAPAFHVLASNIFPQILEERRADDPVRVWVPGCATGEEAYSIAICLLEAVTRMAASPPLQVFGTDLSGRAVDKARAGIYLESIAADVSPERLARFFAKVDGHYQVSKAVRDLCVFAQHNLIRDPPFSRLDLVSCRNVLIYLEAPQQKRLLASFHYALKPSGFLLLGSSETVGVSPLFDLVDKGHRVYVKRPVAPVPPMLVGASAEGTAGKAPLGDEEADARGRMHREADRVMLSHYGPPGVLVDENLDILKFRGDTTAYLEHPAGEPSLNLLKVLRRGLRAEVREALREARTQNRPARREAVPGRRRTGTRVTIQVIPVNLPRPGRGRSFLLLFEEKRPPHPRSRARAEARGRDASRKPTRVGDLEDKLATSRQQQQALVEEQEAINEELQSAHEEVLSSNEELQSINEELETAKEELQSANEELTTVNEELQNRNLELSQATDDMVNLLASLDVPIVMLASDMRVRRFTPAAARLFNLISGDVGRPLSDLRGRIAADLQPSIHAAMDTLAVQVKDVVDGDGRWYSLRVRPYKTRENRIDGVVMLFVDVDELKKGAQRLEQSRAYAEAIVDTVGSPLLILNSRLRVERANRSYYEMFHATPEETEGQALSELGGGRWDVAELKRRLAGLAASDGELKGLALEAEVPEAGRRTMLINARRLTIDDPEPVRILVSIEDRTDEVRAQREREALLAHEEAAARQAENTNRLKDEFIATVSHELRGPLNAMVGWVHVLGSGGLDPATVDRGLAALERAVKAQTRLIEDLLDMSRIMSGKLRLAHRYIDLAEVTRAAIETTAPAAQAKSIDIALQADDRPLFVLGDPDRLQQIVWNLLSNAVKFTPRDGRVDVELRREGTSTQLRITDTGQGISAEFLPHVFEPFRQADSSPARSQQGLGLGLAISRHLVESHGGMIRAESAGTGRGTSMTVLLPVPPLAADMSPAAEPVPGAPPRRPPDHTLLEGVRVLVVEDELDSRDIIAAVLRESGADVMTASSGPEALAALMSERPDVLVSDVGMPGMDGYELLREVRKRGDTGGVPALALTAYAEEESRHQALAAGFDEHVAKPAEPRELLAAVARLAGRQAPRTA